MENIEKVLEKLMANRTRLMLNRFDKEFKEIIGSDLQTFKSGDLSTKPKIHKRNKAA
jgi:hypothetical protein